MVSPELLRRFPIFGKLDDAQLKPIAMIAEEGRAGPGEAVLELDRPSEYLCILLKNGARSAAEDGGGPPAEAPRHPDPPRRSPGLIRSFAASGCPAGPSFSHE